MFKEFLFFKPKIDLKVKLTALFLIVSLFQLKAVESYSQKTKITLHLENVSIEKVLNEIESQTEFKFLYNYNDSNYEKIISIKAKKEEVSSVLERLLKDTNVRFQVLGKQIVLNKNIKKTIEIPKITLNNLEDKTVVQKNIISGTIKDKYDVPIPGVNILVVGTTRGTQTDFDGNYNIEAKKGEVLDFSFIGFKSEKITIADSNTVDLVMVVETSALDEVVVVGYGTKKKESLTGAIVQVKSSDFNKRPITNASQALQGLAAGVLVTQTSGEPGQDEAQIRIRGESSISGSNGALVLVDGIQSSFDEINPDDIETISVLKDAAASAIYGSRAANGVILVTTKRGKSGIGKFSVNLYTGIQNPTALPDMVTDPIQWMELHNFAREVPMANGTIPAPLYSDEMIAEYQQFVNETGFKGSDAFDALFNSAVIHKATVSATGGTDKTSYYMSASYLDQNGVGLGSKFKQGSFRLNLDTQVHDKLKIGTTITPIFGENIRPISQSGSDQFLWAWRWRPTAPFFLPDGRYAVRKFFQSGEWGPVYSNPISYSENGKNNQKRFKVLGSIYLEYEPIENLKIKGTAGGNIKTTNTTLYAPVIENFYYSTEVFAARSRGTNYLSKNNTQNINTLLQLTVDYNFNFNDKHNFHVLGGYSEELFRNEYLSASTSDFTTEGIFEIGNLNPENEQAGSSASHITFRSYFGRANYDYLGKYLFEANFRADATSRFAEENRWGYFPSFSGGWIVSKEDFFNTDGVVNFLKLRGSWGELGNQDVGNYYIYQSSVVQGGDFNYNFGNNGDLALGAGPNSVSNRDAIWEVSRKTDFALEGRLFDNNLTFSFDYFLETRFGQLMVQSVPELAGDLNSPIKNIAEVDIWGWDFEIGYRKKFGELNFRVNANIGHAENEVVDLGGVDQIISGPSGSQLTRVGLPMRTPFLIEANGIYRTHEEAQAGPIVAANQTAGDIAYIDQNGDGIISGRNAIEDKIPVGKPYPEFIYGFNINLEYKGIDLSVLANGVAGVDYWAVNYGVEAFTAQGGIPKRYLTESFSFNKENPTLPRLVYQWNYNGNEGLAYPSTFSLYKGDYLRIKNIQLGYSINDELVTKIGLQKLRVYVNAQNPFIFTSLFEGVDPERPLNNGSSSSFARQPQVRTISVGLNITL